MKKTLLAAITIMGMAGAVLAQGLLNIDNSASAGAICIDRAGNYYSGVYGVEVWALGGSTIPANLQNIGVGNSVAGYQLLGPDSFTKIFTAGNQSMAGGTISSLPGGNLTISSSTLPGYTPGANVVLALAVWNTSAASFNAMLAGADASTRAGMAVFVNPTANAQAQPPPVPATLSGLTSDLVMWVPEPGTFALVGFGAAALLILRRRR